MSNHQKAWIARLWFRAKTSFFVFARVLISLATSAGISFTVSSAILAGCASNQAQIQNVPLSFNAVKTVVVRNLPGGTKRESDNGRTLTSGYFDPQTLKPEDEKKPLKVRAYMIASIYGNGRPYSVDVKVFKEEKEKEGYTNLGEDPDLTDRLAERLRASLADRREDRNIIDDFRVF